MTVELVPLIPGCGCLAIAAAIPLSLQQLEAEVVKAGLSVVGKAVDGSGLVYTRLDISVRDEGGPGLARSRGGGLGWLGACVWETNQRLLLTQC